MDTTLKVLGVLLSALGVIAAIYNIFGGRSYLQDQAQKAKIDQALSLGNSNKQSIENLEQRMNERDVRTEKRLDQIGLDIADVKKLFTDFVIENLRAMVRH